MPRILILVGILLLIFANSTNGSGINRSQIRIRRGRKYPQLTGIKVCFLIFELHYVRLSLPDVFQDFGGFVHLCEGWSGVRAVRWGGVTYIG